MSTLPRPARQWRGGIAAAVIIALASALAAAVALSGSFYADDFRGGSLAARGPWSAEWLFGWQTSRHFAPLQRAHYSALVSVAPLDHAVAVALVTVEFMAMLALFWLIARRLVGQRYGLVALGLLGVNTVLVASFAWLVQAIALMGVLNGWLLATYALMRAHEDRRVRWVVLGVAGWVVAALSWESWLVGPPLLLFLCMVWQQGLGFAPVRRLRAALRLSPAYWAATAVVVVAYLVVWRLGGFGTGSAVPTPSLFLTTLWDTLYLTVLPSLAGGPWGWWAPEGSYSPNAAAPQPLFVATAMAFTALATVSLMRWPAVAARGLVLSIVVPAIVMVLPILGRASQYPGIVQVEPRYVTVAMPCVVLGLAMLVAGLRAGTWPRPWRVAIATAAVIALVVGGTISYLRFVDVWSSNPTAGYVANGRADLAQVGPEVGVFNTEVPSGVLSRWAFLGLNNAGEVFRPVTRDSHGQFGAAGSATMVDGSGRLVPARFTPLTSSTSQPCLPIRDGQSRRVALPSAQLHRNQLTMHLVARSRGAGSLGYSVLAPGETRPGRTSWGLGEVPVVSSTMPVTAGSNERYVLLPPKNVAAIILSPAGTDICLESLAVGVVEPR